MKLRTEVLIIGGGATGVGISRDLSLRGIPSILIEKGDFAAGASGRNHGLLHSGARYAVSDPEAARECMSENRILKRIAPHCIEETEGLFLSLPEDGLDFRDRFVRACEEASIPTTLCSRDEALTLEPELNPDLLSAVRVPDGAIDPFKLVLENARDAESRGAKFFLHTEVISFILDRDKARGITAKDLVSGEEYSIEASCIVNASGAWTNQVLNLAGLHVDMALSKGSLLITNQRISQKVINRCRPPSDGDIIVPNDTVSILGTTSIRSERIEHFEVTPSEVSLLIAQTSEMVPALRQARLIRAYAGIRPLIQSGRSGEDRSISRGFTLIDHGKRDGIRNLYTMTGGKLMTYRLMAEKVTDLVCRMMGIDVSCATHLKLLPGARDRSELRDRLKKNSDQGEILCDCEMIGREEVKAILDKGKLKDPVGILHRTRLAKGTCQGGFCIYRFLGWLHDMGIAEADSNKVLKKFLEERWKGIRPVLWGDTLRQEELVEGIYKGVFNLE